ncbi:HXXEE domain-containing protein [Adlercreutzia equolifaciens]|uniref:HXXEE domain-containing protein n=1 Tax=Adlercreutzia equolifaciens TaxID=446660 RepID=UPI0023B19F98|nr:HXXEE domain-containing protein [Adlercreutzia equolifaciens]MDE8701794.1 HXXEE domain-containing protein [Adlercreutzia equolifaciens]
MKNWVAKYNLEVLTFVLGTFIVCAVALYPTLSIIQRFMIAFMWLFVLHEWEEGKYPGGFVDLMAKNLLKMDVSQETANLSRIPTMILIMSFTVVPFFFDTVWLLVLLPVYLSIFEGIVHVAGIKLFKLKRPYTPGLVTALAEFAVGIGCLAYLITSCPIALWEYLVAVVLYFACFAFMQSRLTKLVGIKYREFPKMMRTRIKEMHGR